jgi:hypothetical protein
MPRIIIGMTPRATRSASSTAATVDTKPGAMILCLSTSMLPPTVLAAARNSMRAEWQSLWTGRFIISTAPCLTRSSTGPQADQGDQGRQGRQQCQLQAFHVDNQDRWNGDYRLAHRGRRGGAQWPSHYRHISQEDIWPGEQGAGNHCITNHGNDVGHLE